MSGEMSMRTSEENEMNIEELALRVAANMLQRPVVNAVPEEIYVGDFAALLISAYLAEQEPVGKVLRNSAGQVWIIWKGETDIIDYVGQQLFTAPPEPASRLPEGCMWAVTKGGHSICQPPKSFYQKGAAPLPEQCCAECGKKPSEGWALYCIKCACRSSNSRSKPQLTAP
jgi:hypothetical protein